MALQFMLAEFHYKLRWHHHQNKVGANYVSSYNHYSFFLILNYICPLMLYHKFVEK